ncbi:Guanosine-5'-triphosphate,3'-diphosphate pyrophosphatase [Enhygromyxa salina]|uniref:Guanosine-5'-triphosphate,3'-diphosphate pyrophosphatase n=1 Tax=Enhygromyxa salina TaxID=215803 RepID=A0A2S9YX57_9BACT|nr:Guanosine-5'-triphosphate,3'-diphosphate pyrophosphatase [Enhygromyxa salina]
MIDIGSNSVLLLLARRGPDGALSIIRDESTVARVSEGAASRGTLSAEAIERTLEVLRRYRSLADAEGVTRITAVATEGLRMGSNAAEFLVPASELLGAEVRLISGDEEARLSYRSVALEHPEVDPLRVIDIGGGSTELVVGRGLEVEQAVSHRLGSVRISELLSDGHPPSAAALDRMLAHAREVLSAQPLAAEPELYGLAGTVTTVTGLLLGLDRYDRELVDRRRVGIGEIARLRGRLASLSLAELQAMPMLGVGRADVVVGGITILLAALEHCGAQTLVVRDRGLRYALIQ